MKRPRVNAEVYQAIGKSLRRARQLAGKSQTDIAAELDVTWQQYQKYEKGSNRIPVDRLVHLCGYFDVPLSRFLTWAEPAGDAAAKGLLEAVDGKELRLFLHSWTRIEDAAVRRNMLNLLKAVADGLSG